MYFCTDKIEDYVSENYHHPMYDKLSLINYQYHSGLKIDMSPKLMSPKFSQNGLFYLKSVQWRRHVISDRRSIYARKPKFNFDRVEKHANANSSRVR